MSPRDPHPMDARRDAALALIKKIADRAVRVYDEHNIRTEALTHIMDLTACHFRGQELRLQDLLDADDANFMHDIAGINRHLDRDTCQLGGGFTPRFALRANAPA